MVQILIFTVGRDYKLFYAKNKGKYAKIFEKISFISMLLNLLFEILACFNDWLIKGILDKYSLLWVNCEGVMFWCFCITIP